MKNCWGNVCSYYDTSELQLYIYIYYVLTMLFKSNNNCNAALVSYHAAQSQSVWLK